MGIEFDRSIKNAMNTGKVHFGMKQTKKAIESGKARLVVISKNAPSKLETSGAKVHRYEGTSRELGSAVGKPFSISYLAVLDPGKSDVLRL